MPAERKRSDGSLTAWPLAAAEAFIKERGCSYTVRETRAPYEKDHNDGKEFYVLKAEIEDGAWELLVCGKTRKGGARDGL